MMPLRAVLALSVSIPFTAFTAAPVPAQAMPQDAGEKSLAELVSSLSYRDVGPARGGRSAAVTGLPGDRQTYYFGGCGGGVWKTTNGGERWTNISDGFFGGSIGAVAVSEWDPNVVYVGGGEKTVRGNVAHGDGLWRSDDAGKTWRSLGLDASRHVSRIRIHPRDENTAWVAVMGDLFKSSQERGVYKTTDGGATWERILFANADAGCVDLALDPTNPRVLYATMWRIRRTPYSLESGGEGSGVWKTTDGGATWTEITRNPGLPGGTVGIAGITVSPSNHENLYLILENANGGVFRSRNAGATWSKVNSERSLRQRAWYYSRIYADPMDEETVYVLNVGFHRSNDGGETYERISVPHGDNHDLWIDPSDPERMIQSNDGGANVSTDGGASWTEQDMQRTAQMYRVSTDNAFPYHLLGGQQDNSAIRIRSRSTSGSSYGRRNFQSTAGGESGHVVAHPEDPEIVFGGSYGGSLGMVNHRTGESRSVNVWPDNPMGAGAEGFRYRFQWNFPLYFSPHEPYALYAASNVLFRSTDFGASWEQISPDLTRNDPTKLVSSGGPITKDNTGVEYYCTIFASFESPQEQGVIWCGSDDGRVHITRNDGADWTEITPRDLAPWTMVNDLVPDPHNPGGAYIAGTRYKLGDFRPYLFKTADYGATWTQIDAGIDPEHFTRAIVADPERQGLLFAGTERGVYASTDDGASWEPFQLDLPIVPVTDLEITEGDLVVATQGRGYWILDDLSPLRQLDAATHDGATVLYEPRPTVRAQGYSVSIDYRIEGGLEDGTEIALEILEADGDVVRRFVPRGSAPRDPNAAENDAVLDVAPGLHRFGWNLAYPGAESFPDMILWAGGMRGPRAAPGDYIARLTVGENAAEVPVSILTDPRSSTSDADLAAQLEFALATGETLTRAHRAIRDIRSVRDDLAALEARLGDVDGADALRADIDAAGESMTQVEEALYQTKNQSRQDPLNFPIRLTDKLSGVRSLSMRGDFAPTSQMRAVAEELTAAIEAELARLQPVFSETIPGIDARARELAVPFIRVPDR